MKGRLITNGILSLVASLGWIIFIAGYAKLFNSLLYYKKHSSFLSMGISELSWGFGILVSTLIANLVMGILTLAMQKDERVQGLTIASGILAILNGMFFVNAIVSFIAVSKLKNVKIQI